MKNRLSLVPPLSMLLAGCALWPRPLVPVHYYTIDPPAVAAKAPGGPARGGVLAVRSLASASRYRERILYRKGGIEAAYHEHERWVEPPAEMVTAVLCRGLAAAGVAGAVVDDRLVRRPDLILDGRVLRFDEVHREPNWLAECEVELILKQAEEGTVLFAGRLAATCEAKGRTTSAFVAAMNAAVAQVAAQAADAIAKSLPAQKPPK